MQNKKNTKIFIMGPVHSLIHLTAMDAKAKLNTVTLLVIKLLSDVKKSYTLRKNLDVAAIREAELDLPTLDRFDLLYA